MYLCGRDVPLFGPVGRNEPKDVFTHSAVSADSWLRTARQANLPCPTHSERRGVYPALVTGKEKKKSRKISMMLSKVYVRACGERW